MTSEEVYAHLDKLREKNHEAFRQWYDQAAFTSVEDYCELGWLMRYWDSIPTTTAGKQIVSGLMDTTATLIEDLVDTVKQLRPDAIDHIDPKPEWWIKVDALLKEADAYVNSHNPLG